MIFKWSARKWIDLHEGCRLVATGGQTVDIWRSNGRALQYSIEIAFCFNSFFAVYAPKLEKNCSQRIRIVPEGASSNRNIERIRSNAKVEILDGIATGNYYHHRTRISHIYIFFIFFFLLLLLVRLPFLAIFSNLIIINCWCFVSQYYLFCCAVHSTAVAFGFYSESLAGWLAAKWCSTLERIFSFWFFSSLQLTIKASALLLCAVWPCGMSVSRSLSGRVDGFCGTWAMRMLAGHVEIECQRCRMQLYRRKLMESFRHFSETRNHQEEARFLFEGESSRP